MSEELTPQREVSRGARRVGRFLRRSWQAITVCLVAVALGVLAYVSPGLVQADVRLDEGTVHAAKRDSGLIGILNTQIDELAAATAVGDSAFNILQDGETVLVHGTQSSTLGAYNPGRNRMESPVQLPTDAQVSFVAGRVLVVNSNNGRVWVGSPDEVLAYDFQNQKADFEVGEFGNATLTASGVAIGIDVQRSVLVRPTGEEQVEETPLPFSLNPDTAAVAISAVGDRAVVLDRSTGNIWTEGSDNFFEVSGASSAQLAAPSPNALQGTDGARAIYATQAGLIALTSDGPRSLSGNLDAPPVQPVQVGDCVYAAFGDQFVRQCVGADIEVRDIPDLEPDAELVFQVTGGAVALNNVVNGHLWMVDKDMLQIIDWEPVAPHNDDQDPDDVVQPDTVIPPDRSQPNQDPIAVDDTLAARAGRSTVLNVLDNDSDPDGDVLTITAPSELSGASLQPVRGGSGLQVTVAAETTGTLSFSYTISDGRGGKDTANVTVRVLPTDPNLENGAPFKHSLAIPVTIQLGETIDKRVLMDWRDPDGDSLILVDAWLPPEAEDEVSFTPDGQVTFLDIGKTTGTKIVNLKVSDGYAVADGELLVVVTDEVVAPIAYGDFATVAVGKTVTINPLQNDIGANLSLTEIDVADCACETSPNYREGWFTFSADAPGVHYIPYKVSNGPIAMGLVRIDVHAESTNTPPVAALDVALLPPGGSVLVDPLLNDTDLDGDVLVVQSVSQHPGLEVVLERRSLVTITARHTPDEPVNLTYRVSDGRHSILGTIVVLPTPTTGSVQPTAAGDEVRVRAGSTQTVDVLANDFSPIGLELTLDALVENPLAERAWISDQKINVSVPTGAQSANVNLTYQVRDADGAIASAQLRVTVVSEDAQNEAPVPRQVVERVLAGTTTRLAVPLAGIDPNGDAVRLVGLGSGPQLGRVLATGDGWLTYEAYPESQGTDVFSYQVIDSFGALTAGEIRVGVAPAGPDNSPPVGAADEVHTRPGRHVQVAALRNDLDIDGDSITYVAADPVEIDGIDPIEIVDNREITFTAPEEPGTYVGKYYIEDARGATGSGDISVVVDEDAPLLPPEARDDLVSVSAVVGKDWVEVDALANDFDPDGPHDQLTVTVPDDGLPEDEAPRATADGLRITAPVSDRMQQIRYTVTDVDGLSDTGLILLPGRNDSVPVLRDPALVLEVLAGQPLGIDLNDHVAGTAGRTVRLTGVDTVSATHGRALPGAQRVEYTPDITYDGPASVVFEVVDEVQEGDRTAKRAYVSIPVTVLPAPNRPTGGQDEDIVVANSPPELVGSQPQLLAGPGEGQVRLDLIPLFRDPDGDSLFFKDFAHAEGDQRISWELSSDESKIYASTDVSTPPGTTRIIRALAVDAKNATTPFTIRLEVTSSTRPLATAVTDVVDEALAGQEFPVAVLLNDKSNLLTDPSLTLVPGSAAVINGSGTASTDGDTVKIRPAEGFVGTLTARYTIEDATLDPNRRVDGVIRVTVKDKPSRPGAPRDGVAGNGTVTFTYTPGSSNGFEISARTARVVNASGGTVATAECPSTTCTVRGLPNGQPYQFAVTETNQAGDSDESPLSAAYTPDVRPLAPAAPVTAFGDKQLTVSWTPPSWEDPSNPGSPVDRYLLALLNEGGSVIEARQLPPSPLTYTWTGLTNGTRYRFMVLASNRAGESPYSTMSNVEWPAGPPSPPASIVATATENPLGGAFEVRWPTEGIDANGDPIRSFVVTPISERNGRVTDKARVVSPTTQSVLIEGLGQTPYKFEVVAENKAGRGAGVTTPQWQTSFELPKITRFWAEPREGGLQMYVEHNFRGRPEAQPRVEYRLNDGGWQAYPPNGSVSGLTNGRSYNVSVRVVVVGDKQSEPAFDRDIMPRAAEPTFPGYLSGSATNVGFDGSRQGVLVVMDHPDSTEDTGGWELGRYRYRCSVDGSGWACDPNGDTSTYAFVISRSSLLNGATVNVAMRYSMPGFGDDFQSSASIPLEQPLVASFNSDSKVLRFDLNYLKGSLSCTATPNAGEPVAWSSASFSATLGPDATSVKVTCSNPNFSGSSPHSIDL